VYTEFRTEYARAHRLHRPYVRTKNPRVGSSILPLAIEVSASPARPTPDMHPFAKTARTTSDEVRSPP
ncbi:MAG: hypothetical protein ABI311_11395, partial [Gemmatimonadaceae bacterium]